MVVCRLASFFCWATCVGVSVSVMVVVVVLVAFVVGAMFWVVEDDRVGRGAERGLDVDVTVM